MFRPVLLTAMLGLSLFTGAAAAADLELVTSHDGQLWEGEQPYVFSATNSYRMLESKAAVDEQLAAMQALGLNALRFWAFNNGEAPAYEDSFLVYNRTPGQWPATITYPENAWRQLDYAIKRAGDYHIRLIVTLGNYWDEGGGINTLARWTQQGADHDQFYSIERARSLYAAMVERMTHRVNHLTGVAYKDDPTILMWEPLNEARGRGDASGQTSTAWLNWAATTIKANDAKHLVGSGTEGFFAQYTNTKPNLSWYDFDQYAFKASLAREITRYNPLTKSTERQVAQPEGMYFPNDCALSAIDVCSIHAWPQSWFITDLARPDLFLRVWVETHRDAIAKQNIIKPLYLGEFGLTAQRNQSSGLKERDTFYQAAYDIATETKTSGVGFWLLGFNPDWGHNQATLDVVCMPNGTWDSTCNVIRQGTAKLQRSVAP